MSRSRVVSLVLLAGTAVLALSGCASGFHPQTTPSLEPRDGANYPVLGNDSPLAIRHAFVLGPSEQEAPFAKGADAAIYLSIVNQSKHADRLVSVSTKAAKDPKVSSGGGSTTSKQQESSSGIDVPAPPAGSDEAAAVEVGQPPYSTNSITLGKLTKPLRNGSVVHLTFEFQRAGTISMDLPVTPQADYFATLSPAPTESPSESGTGTSSPSSGASESATETESP